MQHEPLKAAAANSHEPVATGSDEFGRAGRLAARTGLCLGLICGLAYWLWAGQQISFDATARLSLKSSPVADNNSSLDQSNLDAVDRLWHSVDFLAGAVADHKLGERTTLGQVADPIQWLSRRLRLAACGDDAQAVDVSLRASSPREACFMLAALLANFQARKDVLSAELAHEGPGGLDETRTKLLKTLREKEAAYADFRRNTVSPARTAEEAKLRQQRSAELAHDRTKLILKISELEAQIETLEDFIAQRQYTAAWEWIDRHQPNNAPNDPATSPPREGVPGLDALRAKEAELLTKWGRNHPQVRAVRAQIEALQNGGDETSVLRAQEQSLLREYGPNHPRVKEFREQMRNGSGKSGQPGAIAPLALRKPEALVAYVASLKQKVRGYHDELKALETAISRTQDALPDDDEFRQDAEKRRADLQRTQQLRDTFELDLLEQNGNRSSAKYVRDIMDHLVPTAHRERSPTMLVVVALVGGLVSAGGTMTWTRWRSKSSTTGIESSSNG